MGKSRFLEEVTAAVPEMAQMSVQRLRRPEPGGPRLPLDADGCQTGSGGQRLLLVDDAHELDEEAGALVHHLATGGSMFVLVAARHDLPCPASITTIWKDGLGPRLGLFDLDLDETAALLHQVLGSYVESETVHQVWNLTRGNPQFLWELISHGLASRQLRPDADSLWAWPGPMTMGARLEELVLHRLGLLDTKERALLQLVAVAGRLLTALIEGLDPGCDRIAALETKGLLREVTDDAEPMVEMTNPLFAQALRSQGMLGLRSAALKLADAIEARGDLQTELAYLSARYRTLAGKRPDASTAALAAVRATRLTRLDEAEQLALLAIEGGEVHRGTLAFADVLGLRNRYPEAEEALSRMAEHEQNDDELAETVASQGMTMFWGMGQGPRAMNLLAAASKSVKSAVARDNLVAARDCISLVSGEAVRPDERYREVLARSTTSECEPVALRMLLSAVPAWLINNDLDLAAHGLEVALAAARRLPDAFPLAEERLHLFRWFHLCLEGRLGDAMVQAEVQHRRAMGIGNRTAATLWVAASARGLLVAGQAQTARDWLQEAWPRLDRPDRLAMMPTLLTERAATRLLTGDVAGAADDLAKVNCDAPSAGIWIGAASPSSNHGSSSPRTAPTTPGRQSSTTPTGRGCSASAPRRCSPWWRQPEWASWSRRRPGSPSWRRRSRGDSSGWSPPASSPRQPGTLVG